MQLQDTVVMQYYTARLWAENDQSKHLGAQLSCASTWQEYLPLYGRTDFKILFLILTIVCRCEIEFEKKQGLCSQLCAIAIYGIFEIGIPDICHFFYTGKIYGE